MNREDYPENLKRLLRKCNTWIKEGLCRSCGAMCEPRKKQCSAHLAYGRRYHREKRKKRTGVVH